MKFNFIFLLDGVGLNQHTKSFKKLSYAIENFNALFMYFVVACFLITPTHAMSKSFVLTRVLTLTHLK